MRYDHDVKSVHTSNPPHRSRDLRPSLLTPESLDPFFRPHGGPPSRLSVHHSRVVGVVGGFLRDSSTRTFRGNILFGISVRLSPWSIPPSTRTV